MLQAKESVPNYKPATSKSWIDIERVYAEIEIIPTRDLILAAEGHLEASKIRKSTFRFVVDSGAVNPDNPFTAKHYLK